MVSEEQAKQFVEKLSELIDENAETNNVLAKKTYAEIMQRAKVSIETRIALGEFPTIAALRKKFGTNTSEQ